MSDQTTANTPSEPVLCTKGCGFFGNAATNGCCSKCWRDGLKEKDDSPMTCLPAAPTPATSDVESEQTEEPMEVEETEEAPVVEAPQPMAETPKKKKKKKASYKSMMKGMMKPASPTKDIEKEKEGLRKVTGGGAFSKIEKI